MLSQTKRRRGGVPFRLMDRDITILRAVNRYRYLRTSQVNELIFSGNTSIQSARRRLKLLYQNNYLGRIQPFLQKGGEEQPADIAYHLGKLGQAVLEELGDTVFRYSKANQARHKFLLHALDLSQFRVSMELALANRDNLDVERFIPYFQMKEGLRSASGNQRYRIFDEVREPVTGKIIVVYPDAAVILQSVPGGVKRLIFVEIDRGTEGLEIIREKLFGYQLYFRRKGFSKYGVSDKFTVLFQTSSQQRAENMAALTQSIKFEPNIFFTSHQLLNEKTIFDGEIWIDSEGKPRALLRK